MRASFHAAFVLAILGVITFGLLLAELRRTQADDDVDCDNQANIANSDLGDVGLECSETEDCFCGWMIGDDDPFYQRSEEDWWCASAGPVCGYKFTIDAGVDIPNDLCSIDRAQAEWKLPCSGARVYGDCSLDCLKKLRNGNQWKVWITQLATKRTMYCRNVGGSKNRCTDDAITSTYPAQFQSFQCSDQCE